MRSYLLVGLLVLAAGTLPTHFVGLAADRPAAESIDPWDKPGVWLDRHTRGSEGWFVWRGPDKWHVRARSMALTRFTGMISIEDGTVSQLEALGTEVKRKPGLTDVGFINPARNQIRLDFKTRPESDGIAFAVSEGTAAVTFELYVNGQRRPDLIHIGGRSAHPADVRFTLPAQTKRTGPKPTPTKPAGKSKVS